MFGLFQKKDYVASINSGQEAFTVKAGDNLLKAALNTGLAWPHDCRVGSCGTCKCKLLEGKIKPLSDFSYVLEVDELQDNYILACQTALKTDIKVDVELTADHAIHWEFDTVIKEIKELTHNIKEVIVEINDADLLAADEFLYEAGQYADIKTADLEDARSYSFASAPEPNQKQFNFYIKHASGGGFTDWLFGQDATGQSIKVSGPYGNFGLVDGVSPINCVAGGSGMSAILSILQAALQSKVKRDVRFIFGARKQEDLYCEQLIQDMATNWENNKQGRFEYIPCLSDEPENSSWEGARGICTNFIKDEDVNLSGQAYLCGPPVMIDIGIEVFKNNGFGSDAIFFDKFLDSSTMPNHRRGGSD